MNFSQLMNKILEIMELNPASFGKKYGINKYQVYHYVAARRQPSGDHLEIIREALKEYGLELTYDMEKIEIEKI